MPRLPDTNKKARYNDAFPSRLRNLMKEHGTTQEEIKTVLGLNNRQSVTGYVDGSTNPTIDKLYLLAKYFGVPADYLIGLSDEPECNQTVRSVCEYTGLSSAAINYLHFYPEKEVTSFYRKLFDSIINTGEDGLDAVPGYIKQAAIAHVLATQEGAKTNHLVENHIGAITRKGNAYVISAAEAEDYYLLQASSEISKNLSEVIGNMEYDVIEQLNALRSLDLESASIWTLDEEDDYKPWFPESNYKDGGNPNGEH